MYVLPALVFYLLLQTPSPTTQPEKPVIHNGEATNKTANRQQPAPVVTPDASISTPVGEPSTESQKNERQGETDKGAYRVKVISQPFDWLYLLYVIVTAVAAFVAWRALVAIRKQSEILTDSQRSWFLIKQVQEPAMDGVWRETITYIFQVIGHSPVRVIESKLIFRLVEGRKSKRNPKKMEADLPDTPVYGQPDTLLDIPTMGDIVAPGDGPHVPVGLDTQILKKEEVEELKTWKKFAVAYGFVRYRDAFAKSKIRETRFCYVYDVPQGLIPPDRAGKTNPNTFRVGGPPEYNDVT